MNKKYSIARTIYEQLGGDSFAQAIDYEALVFLENGLIAPLPPNKSEAKAMYIKYNRGGDYYSMNFLTTMTHNLDNLKVCASIPMTFCDQLQDDFTNITGIDIQHKVTFE